MNGLSNMSISIIVSIVVAAIIIELFGYTFVFNYCEDAFSDDDFAVVASIFFVWWGWTVVLLYAIIKKPTQWLAKKLS